MTASPQLPAWISVRPEGVIVRLYVQPKASRSEIVGNHGQGDTVRLKVRVAAPPVEGSANDELFRLLKKLTGISLSRIHLIRGEAAKSKDVLFQGTSAQSLVASLLQT